MKSFPTLWTAAAAVALPLGGMLMAASTAASPAPPMPTASTADLSDTAKAEFFEKNIRPLLTAQCVSCHGAGGRASGGLALDTRDGWAKGGSHGPAVVPGKPETSWLLKAVEQTDPDLAMPPGRKLPDAQIALIRQWIAMGAPDPRGTAAGGGVGHLSGMTNKARAHWAFQPIRKPEIPVVHDKTWVRNPIDAFVLAKLESQKMHPAAPASRASLIRRATYDMLGLPPTVEEVSAFENDKSPNAWTKVVDRLLASPQYGERWARHWLDSARYSDTRGLVSNAGKAGYEDYRYPDAWTYRDYVIKALNDDKPYDQFLQEQIAADRLPDIKPGDPRLAALGFLTVGKRFQNPDDTLDERIDTISKATMGLTVSCARCHDHKFDPIPQADYYAFHGILASTIEPTEKPELASSAPVVNNTGAQEYKQKMDALVAKGRAQYYQLVGEKLDVFQQNAEGYLMLARTPPKSTEHRTLAERYHLYPDDQEITNGLRPRGGVGGDPVLGPFYQLSRIPAGPNWPNQASRVIAQMMRNQRNPANPVVAQALANARPQSLSEVARAYAGLFAEAKKQTPAYIAMRASGEVNLPASLSVAFAQIIETPYGIPPSGQMDTIDKLRERVERLPLKNARGANLFPFAEANALTLTDSSAPGHAMVVADAADPHDSYIYLRGDKFRRGPLAPRHFLTVLSRPDSPTFSNGSGRLELAKDITVPFNPLTSRVLVNRVWMQHFGAGFVRTPDDLGNQCEDPSHPELLDWLSSYVVENNWSVKKLHRAILMSNTYQESSQAAPAVIAAYTTKDPANRLLWRSNLRRLDFEAIRDSLVLLTDKMDKSMYGKPVNLTDEPYSYRRSVYGYVDRLNLSDLMNQFDFADPDMANSQRISTIVPQQALFFMNSPMAIDVAREVTVRPDVAGAPSDPARVRALYHVLYQRDPRPDEITAAQGFLASAEKLASARPGGREIVRAEQQANRRAQTQAANRLKRAQTNRYGVLQNSGETVERAPLTPWQLYAQALLCSNEFVYVN